MEVKEIIELLNSELEDETQAILFYMTIHANSKSHKVKLAMLEVALEEMHHAQKISEAIVDLDGEAIINPRLYMEQLEHEDVDFDDEDDEIELLEKVVSLEEAGISKYTKHISIIDDEEIKELLTRVLGEEKEHLEEFKEILEDLVEDKD